MSDKVSQIDCRPRLDVCSFHLPMCSNISSMYSISAPILLIFFLDRWRCVSFFWHTLVSPFPSLVCRVHAVRCSHVYLCPPPFNTHPPRREIVGAWVALGVVTLLYPPTLGWLRPHRHSDNPGNRGGFGGLKE